MLCNQLLSRIDRYLRIRNKITVKVKVKDKPKGFKLSLFGGLGGP